MRLGKTGFRWLCIRAANCAGHDKKPFDERVTWVLGQRDAIIASAEDPLGNPWWADRDKDEPWALLATCLELAEAWKLENPHDFVSHLPVPMDATCSGLQHLSALALDPCVAEKVNLAGGPRQDIYMEVASRVAAQIETDADQNNVHAKQWRGKVTRNLVKRPIMTTPYGVTARGIRGQILEQVIEGKVDIEQGIHLWDAIRYLEDVIEKARYAAMPRAMEIMQWLQNTAGTLAAKEYEFKWRTPTESICRQSYAVLRRQRIATPLGTLSLRVPAKRGKLDTGKQKAGAAPNFIHSLDAAHLSKTVVAAFAKGIHSFAVIHDSFGTHAAHADALARVLREQFIAIYQTDWLRELADGIERERGFAVAPPPARGDFDLSLVNEAVFAFS